jgi:hypothetical protein
MNYNLYIMDEINFVNLAKNGNGVSSNRSLDADGSAPDAVDDVADLGHGGQEAGAEDPEVAVLDAQAELHREEVALRRFFE